MTTKPLSEVVQILKGKKVNNLFEQEIPGSVPYILIPDLTMGKPSHFTSDNFGLRCEPTDVLIAWDGATAGKSGFGFSGYAGSTVGILRPDSSVLSPNYLAQFIRLKKNELNSGKGGSAVPHINRRQLEGLLIYLPPLAVQQQIAAILEKADAAREKRRQANQLTEQFLQSVFLEMFGDPATNPKGWKLGIIGDAVEYSEYGTSEKSNDEKRGYPILGMGNITYDGQLDLSRISYVDLPVDEFKKLRLQKGDIIFNRTNSTELVGKTVCWNLDVDAVLASYLVKLRLIKDVNPFWFSQLLNTRYFKIMFMRRCKKAVGQSNISPSLLKEFPMYFPPLSEQQKFAALVEKVESLRAKQRQSEQELEHLFHSLMQRAFRGELS
jgi:type I restriction enzyme S subunit